MKFYEAECNQQGFMHHLQLYLAVQAVAVRGSGSDNISLTEPSRI